MCRVKAFGQRKAKKTQKYINLLHLCQDMMRSRDRSGAIWYKGMLPLQQGRMEVVSSRGGVTTILGGGGLLLCTTPVVHVRRRKRNWQKKSDWKKWALGKPVQTEMCTLANESLCNWRCWQVKSLIPFTDWHVFHLPQPVFQWAKTLHLMSTDSLCLINANSLTARVHPGRPGRASAAIEQFKLGFRAPMGSVWATG